MKIAILSIYSGQSERGVETWAANLAGRSKENVVIISGNYLLKLKSWIDVDIVIPTNGRLQVLSARLLTFLSGKPMIVFGHSGLGADDKWNLLCMPNVFVSFTNAQKKWVDRFRFKKTKSIVINHAVDTSVFKPKGAKHGGKNVLCVAANDPDKRVDLVLKAVGSIKNVNLRVVGSNQHEEVPYKNMPEVYNSADIFCFVPQPWEALGLVYLKAMACNLPVVTINDPVRKEIVGEAGILIDDPEKTDSLSDAITQALKKDWADKPLRQAKKFSWETVIQKYDNLFRSFKL